MLGQLFVLKSEATSQPCVFSNKRKVRVSLPLYIEHVQSGLGLSNEMLAAAYNLLATFLENALVFVLTPFNVQRTVFTSLALVHKFLSEKPVTQFKLAEVSGIPSEELNKCEVAFLKVIEWKLSLGDVDRTLSTMLNHAHGESSSEDEVDLKHLNAEENEEFSELSAFF